MKPIIEVNHLYKKYKIGEKQRYYSFRDTLVDLAKAPFKQKNKIKNNTFWALKDISFKVMPGEVIGIIGRNGAGKSTLLKILSRITPPTKGEITLRGRVASLLEVGTGFHPELTGRENIYLNGAILGMKRTEINKKFDEIVEFAEISKFLDTPVKFYSSGMYMRLAFAIAAHLDPEILLVDEVLAVGDIEFQKKCLGKMGEVAKAGRTVLFVSHNMEAVSTLTAKAIYLKNGASQHYGKTADVITQYVNANKKQARTYEDKTPSTEPKITKVQLFTSLPNNVQKNGDKMVIEISIKNTSPIHRACLSFQITDAKDRNFAHLWTFDSETPMCRSAGTHIIRCLIPKLRLYMGKYFLKIYLSEPPGGEQFQVLENICPFEVVMYGKRREFQWQPNTCAYLEDATWEIIP